MIERLKRFFTVNTGAGTSDNKKNDRRDILVASCALLLEIATIDGEFSETEKGLILSIVKDEYGLDEKDALALVEDARKEVEQSIDLWQFTNLINKNYSLEQKIRIIETIWMVIYADGRLEKHEDYLVHNLADLLRLDHKHLIDAKLKIKASLS
ncbi:MAG TPA: TerB family tellurite resistance protein [Deltaproteobacteria bacterium]|nr:TerB family tellurite resistance protein [Deltaproteobacteria bacterium]